MSDEGTNQIPPEAEDPDVEAHLLKEALAAGSIAIGAAGVAGTAQAMPNQLPVPGAGGGAAQLPVPGSGGGSAQVPVPGAGGGSAQVPVPGAGGGSAQVPVPGAGGGSAQVPVPGAGGGEGLVPVPGAGGGAGQNTDPGGGSGMAAKKHAPAKQAKPKSKVHKHQGSTHTTPPNKPPLQPEG